MSPMKRSGISTAISETVSERIVKPIWLEPVERGLQRRLALLDVAGDVLDHHDRVVHDEAGGDGQRHQREVVQAEAEQRTSPPNVPTIDTGTATPGMNVAAAAAQEQEDDEDDQDDGQHQLELHVVHRGADGRRAVGQHRDLHRRRQSALELRQELLDAVDDLDQVGAGLALDVDDDRRRDRPSTRPAGRSRRRRSPSATSESRSGRAVAVGDRRAA